MFCTTYKELCGPYNSYEEFCEAALRSAQLHTAVWGSSDAEEQQHEQNLLSKLESSMKTWSSTPTFTHVDPGIQNMIVRQIPGPSGETNWEATLID